MTRILTVLLIMFAFLPAVASAQSDFNDCLPGWDYYYIRFKISGYPEYNASLERYDFYDIENNYCGSLCYNAINEKWEYFGL
ncbi:MAG: hypothetical protein PHH60_05890 [Candidatus Margulisbacteria bacterium]|nr:hypothetical protein [Candidatus Margulisiibacteriota bacterium]